MAQDVSSNGSSVDSGTSPVKYAWNPFNDIVDNAISGELLTVKDETTANYQTIIVPRNGPFFATDVTVTVMGSSTPLSLEAGDYCFVYPYMTFLKDYQRLVYGGILLLRHNKGTTYSVDYHTLGGGFTLDDANYLKFVGNINNNPRTANWDQLVNLPTGYPPNPHDHPVADTVGYLDMITWMKSYLDALTSANASVTLSAQFEDHLRQTINKAHGGGLAELGVKYLRDLPLCDATTVKGESTEVYANIWGVKNLIRGYLNGDWK